MRTLNQVLAENHLLENRILQWRDNSNGKILYVSQPGTVEFVCFNKTEDFKQALLWEKIRFGSHFSTGNEKGLLLVQYYNANKIPYEMIYAQGIGE